MNFTKLNDQSQKSQELINKRCDIRNEIADCQMEISDLIRSGHKHWSDEVVAVKIKMDALEIDLIFTVDV